MSPFVVGVVLDRGGEEGIDESCLAQAGLARDLEGCSSVPAHQNADILAYHDGEGSTTLCDDFVPLVR